MSLFGKILAVLNVFGMVGLLILGLLTYAKQQTWKYANYRHDLFVEGLPSHKEVTDRNGQVSYLEISEQTKKDLFPTNPVVTQKEEVERVQKVLEAQLEAKQNEEQTLLYVSYLLPLALDNMQRERLLSIRAHLANPAAIAQLEQDFNTAYLAAEGANKANPAQQIAWTFNDRLVALRGEPRGPLEEAFLEVKKKDPNKANNAAFKDTLVAVNANLKAQFDGAFKEALEGQRFVEGAAKKMTPEERKDAVSTLLFNLVDAEAPAPADAKGPAELYSIPGYKRYLAVVGLEQAVRTINRQAMQLSRIASDLELERDRERYQFAETLKPLVDRAKQSALNGDQLAKEFEREQEKVRKQQVLVDQRMKNVEDAKNELAGYRMTMATKMAELRQRSKEVFDKRVEVRDATVANQEYERTIRHLEGWRWLPFVGGKFLINREEP